MILGGEPWTEANNFFHYDERRIIGKVNPSRMVQRPKCVSNNINFCNSKKQITHFISETTMKCSEIEDESVEFVKWISVAETVLMC